MQHSAALAIIGKTDEVLHRLWTGQLTVIYPVIEEHRRRLAAKYDCLLTTLLPIKTDYGDIVSIGDVEIGLIAFHLIRSNAPKADCEVAVLLKEVRNALAHFEPLSPELLRRFVATIS